MKKKNIIIFCFFLLILNINAQIGFQRTIGGASSDFGQSIIQTSDGGFAIVGYTNSYSSSTDLYVVKLSDTGTIQWSKIVGGASNDFGCSLVQTTEGSLITVGYTNSFGQGSSDFHCVKLSNNGEIQWNKTLGQQGSDQAYSIALTMDGGFILGGYTPSGGAGSADCNFIKVDNNFNILWTRVVGGSGYERINAVYQTMDGGYVGCGYTNSFGSGNYDVYIIKLNNIGILQWSKAIGGSSGDYGYSINQDSDSNFVIAGYTSSFGAGLEDFYILKIDKNGQLLWTKTIGGTGSDIAYSISKTTDGGIITGGSTNSFGAGLSDYYLVKMSNNGVIQWSKTTGSSNSEASHCVKQTTDGSYIMVGNTQSFGSGWEDIYVVKFDPNGNTCGSFSSPSSLTSSGGFMTSGGISGASSPILNSPNYSFGTGGNLTSVCNLVNILSNSEKLPNTYEMLQNFPNPFNPLTTIKFYISKETFVEIIVVDITGKEVKKLINRYLNTGYHEVRFDGTNLSSGIYLYRMQAGTFVETKKMILVK